MQSPIESLEYKNHTINIYPDDDAENPRNWDNIGTMICFHSRYSLGDKHNFSSDDLPSSLIAEFGKNAIILPLYLYDHSGITISSSPFSCPWDSGQIGVIVCSREKAIHEFGKKIFTSKVKRLAISAMLAEVKTYDLYLTGRFVGFTVTDKNDSIIDSCFGFDDIKYAISEAKGCIDSHTQTVLKARILKLKALIRAKAPLSIRQLSLNP